MKRIFPCSNYHMLKYYDNHGVWYVYKLLFESKFYIGVTSNMSKRIAAHRAAINRILIDNADPSTAYSKIIPHIKEHGIKSFSFKIYCFCDDKFSVLKVEELLLKKYFSNHNCLNATKLSSVKGSEKAAIYQLAKPQLDKWFNLFEKTDITKLATLYQPNNSMAYKPVRKLIRKGICSDIKLYHLVSKYYKTKNLKQN